MGFSIFDILHFRDRIKYHQFFQKEDDEMEQLLKAAKNIEEYSKKGKLAEAQEFTRQIRNGYYKENIGRIAETGHLDKAQKMYIKGIIDPNDEFELMQRIARVEMKERDGREFIRLRIGSYAIDHTQKVSKAHARAALSDPKGNVSPGMMAQNIESGLLEYISELMEAVTDIRQLKWIETKESGIEDIGQYGIIKLALGILLSSISTNLKLEITGGKKEDFIDRLYDPIVEALQEKYRQLTLMPIEREKAA